ncbi:hypothetical protein FRX31_008188, partial [Thalictrum thalictroides]
MSVLFVDVEQKEKEGYLKKEMESPNFSTITCNGFEKNQSNNNKDSISKDKEVMMNGLPKKTSSNDLGALTGEDDDEGGGDDEDEVESELKGALGSMGSLEECLPI